MRRLPQKDGNERAEDDNGIVEDTSEFSFDKSTVLQMITDVLNKGSETRTFAQYAKEHGLGLGMLLYFRYIEVYKCVPETLNVLMDGTKFQLISSRYKELTS